MSVKIFTIPFDHNNQTFYEDELNDFMLKNSIKNLKTGFFNSSSNSYWTVFVEYENILKPHEKEETEKQLTQPQKLLMEKLFQFRRQRAEKDGVPVFIIATNSQFRDIAIRTPKTIDQLKRINGFGKKKIQKYGKDIIDAVKSVYTMDSTGKDDSKGSEITNNKTTSEKSIVKTP